MSNIRDAFLKVGINSKRTPLNPSRKAIARVTNPLPVPTVCPNCGDPVTLESNAVIYGREYGKWPWAYVCSDREDCDSYVGLHPFTNIPLGTLADWTDREARKEAKSHFNPIWESGRMTRAEAYEWLSAQLGIPNNQCHIGWFDADSCARVIDACKVFE